MSDFRLWKFYFLKKYIFEKIYAYKSSPRESAAPLSNLASAERVGYVSQQPGWFSLKILGVFQGEFILKWFCIFLGTIKQISRKWHREIPVSFRMAWLWKSLFWPLACVLLLPLLPTLLPDFFGLSIARRSMKLGKLIPYGYAIVTFYKFWTRPPPQLVFFLKNTTFSQIFLPFHSS